MSKEMRQMIDKVKNFKQFVNENKDATGNITQEDKLEVLKKDFPKEFNKYYKAMSHQITSVEIDALYNVLVLDKESEYELTRRWEHKVREILSQ